MPSKIVLIFCVIIGLALTYDGANHKDIVTKILGSLIAILALGILLMKTIG